MKKLSAEQEKKVFLAHEEACSKCATEEEIRALNSKLARQIYSPEICVRCGHTVSMLSSDKLCGCCEYEERGALEGD